MNKYIYALGFFDGVHLGHQALLTVCRALARDHGCAPAAITFDRHPKSLFTDTPTVLISTIPDRELLLGRYGMEKVWVLPVTRQTMSQPWQDFLEELVQQDAAGFVCGDDFHFGHRGEGNAEKLGRFCQARGLPFAMVPEQLMGRPQASYT